jgi:hypothetical protein
MEFDNENIEPPSSPVELPRDPYLPPKEEVATATPDQRAILYAEALARAKASGAIINFFGIQAACGLLSELNARHAPRLLKEDPDFAAEVKTGRKKLPKNAAAWRAFWKERAKEVKSPIGDSAPIAADDDLLKDLGGDGDPETEKVSDSETPDSEDQKSPIGDPVTVVEATLEKVSDSETPIDPRARFEELKRIIHARLDAFLEVGVALIEIRDQKFYQFEGFETFEDFYRSEFQLSKPHAYRLIDAVASVAELSDIPGVPPPTNLEQVRHLGGLSPEEKKEVWSAAVGSAPAGKGPTGAHVKKTRAALGKGKPPTAKKAKNAPPPKEEINNSPPPKPLSIDQVSPEIGLGLAAESLEETAEEWKRASLAPLQENSRLTDRIAGELETIEEEFDAFVKDLVERIRALAS